MSETDITINGTRLTEGQAITLRVALCAFMMELRHEHYLGDDAQGKELAAAYLARGLEIQHLMIQPTRRATLDQLMASDSDLI